LEWRCRLEEPKMDTWIAYWYTSTLQSIVKEP
jgi:hypothetical protein